MINPSSVSLGKYRALSGFKFCSIESISSRSQTITSFHIVKRSPPQSPARGPHRPEDGGRGGREGYLTNIYTGRLLPEVQPLPFYTIFHEKGTPFSYLV